MKTLAKLKHERDFVKYISSLNDIDPAIEYILLYDETYCEPGWGSTSGKQTVPLVTRILGEQKKKLRKFVLYILK